MNLGEGLEEIGASAFQECILLDEISIPPAVKVIKKRAFWSCSQLAIVYVTIIVPNVLTYLD